MLIPLALSCIIFVSFCLAQCDGILECHIVLHPTSWIWGFLDIIIVSRFAWLLQVLGAPDVKVTAHSFHITLYHV